VLTDRLILSPRTTVFGFGGSRQDEHPLSAEHAGVDARLPARHRDQAPGDARLVEGIAYFNATRRKASDYFEENAHGCGQEKYAERTYDQYATTYFDRVPYPSMSGIRTVLDSIAKDFPKAKGADPASFSDPSILKSLEESGFIKSLYE
jgi:hypothetical protein